MSASVSFLINVWSSGRSGGTLAQRLKDFLMQHTVGKELLADAEWTQGDVHWRNNIPYYSTTNAGYGFSLVGDAAAFLDPFYSPGMDWISLYGHDNCGVNFGAAAR